MESWIFITILGAIIGVNSNTIVYPGKSALLSYSPARGEFPVESLFGRGYFSYVDDHGISRTVSLEPNPLLGVRVSGGDGKLSADLGNSVELRKGDGLKPIKEFDERPFQDNLHEKDMSFLAASVLDSSSKVVDSSAQLKGDQGTNPKQQQEVIPLYQKAVTAPAQGSGITYWGGSQNLPLMLSNQPIAPRPFAVQGLFNPQNPFLNQQLGVPVASGVQQPLPGQVFFIPTTGAINPAVIPTSPGAVPQVFPQRPLGGIDPTPSELQELKPINQQTGPVGSPISSIGEQVFINPAPNNPALTNPPVAINSPQQMPNQAPQQIVPSAPSTSATSPVSTIPGSEAPLLTKPQDIASNPLLPTSNVPGILPGNSYLPPSKYPSVPQPPQEIFMIKPGNPFLELATNKDRPIPLPTTTTTTAAPPFNPDKNNPFLINSLKPDVKLELPTVLPTTVKPIPHLPGSTSCNYLSVGPPAPEQIKDTPEVEQAKRDHFKAHELALAQLAQAQARQNNDNTNQQAQDESSLPLTSSVSDNSPLYLTANAPLDQQSVISGPTAATFEQTTVNAAVESEIATIQPLPV